MSLGTSLKEASLYVLSLAFGSIGGVLGLILMLTQFGWMSLPVGVGAGLLAALGLAYHNMRRQRDEARESLAQAFASAGPDWRVHEARFAALSGEAYAMWSYEPESGVVEWGLYRSDGVSDRDFQMLQAEMAAAGTSLRSVAGAPQRFAALADSDPIDVWLNGLAATIAPHSGVKGMGRDEHGQRSLSGQLLDLAEASRHACSQFAIGYRPPARDRARVIATALAKHVASLDHALNAAVEAGFGEDAPRLLARPVEYTADEVSLHCGPAERVLFLTAPPHSQTYTRVPPHAMADWQVNAGRLFHLRALAARYSVEAGIAPAL